MIALKRAAAFVTFMLVMLYGVGDPMFRTAVETWLDDNDADSLPVLSSLAHNGNVAARLLLSRIETTDRASGDYVKGLSRAERLNLFRPETGSGVFRPSWLKTESDAGNAIAKALLDGTALGINIAAIQRLYDIGEVEATEHLVRKVAVDGSQVERQELAGFLPPQSELAPYLRAFRHAREGVTTGQTALQHMLGTIEGVGPESVELGHDADTRQAMEFVDIGYQAGGQTSDFGESNKYFQAVTRWVMSAPEATAVAKLCRQVCDEEEIPACTNTAFGLIGGYYEVVRFDSPMEAIVPQSRFLASKRASGMTLRRIAFTTTEAGEDAFLNRRFSEQSKCLANAAAALRAQSK